MKILILLLISSRLIAQDVDYIDEPTLKWEIKSYPDMFLTKYLKLDTTKGYVEYMTIKGREFRKAERITKLYNYKRLDNAGHVIGKGQYRELQAIILLTGAMVDITKPYIFFLFSDLQRSKLDGGIVFDSEIKQ